MRGMRLSATLLWLTALWVALWGAVTLANILSGLIVAVIVLAFARLPAVARGDETTARIKPLRVLWFLVYVLYKLIEANLVLAWEIITPRNRIRTGVVAVPLRTESDIAMMLVANMVTLTPGTITIESKGSPPVLYVHVLHLRELDSVRRDLYRLEDLAVKAFGTPAARDQLSVAEQMESAGHTDSEARR